uniref:Uncharacterized protein n=1 Tax=Chromera velia CCMP2878 TaxID=1169474 RepID=A0A0G4FCE0_9ALVE|eukprot:Cvel_16178.t1-p1 / transcript=Cvel_16178.t1 / gene=Cvel_16178 / organism=Chromera_velia_CCMP2878 / gene_product=Radial spoke head protein 3 homolog, putative / transcript_product=Radial spoke head protein 3 homolog, putative / location=Cvel_scaffold1234:10062-18099(+) / protein_length=497 / sequence_SO=supercontig / SO=protein_coding / is_pseudo=false
MNKSVTAAQRAQPVAGTHSFSTVPRPVSSKKKYRDYISGGDVNEAGGGTIPVNMMFDKRVHRGCTYSAGPIGAGGDPNPHSFRKSVALQGRSDRGHGQWSTDAVSPQMGIGADPQEGPRGRGRVQAGMKMPGPLDIPLPEPEREPLNLDPFLIAPDNRVKTQEVLTQCDPFLPRPPAPRYLCRKRGVDAFTQVEDGELMVGDKKTNELFVFHEEIKPVVSILCDKTIEQALTEVEEAHELSEHQTFREEWRERRRRSKAEETALEEEERQRHEEKQRQVLNEKKRSLGVLSPDSGVAIEGEMFDWICGCSEEIGESEEGARTVLDVLILEALSKASVESRTAREKGAQTKTRKEMLLRAVVDREGKGPLPVGPVKVNRAMSLDEAVSKLLRWMELNTPWALPALSKGAELGKSENLSLVGTLEAEIAVLEGTEDLFAFQEAQEAAKADGSDESEEAGVLVLQPVGGVQRKPLVPVKDDEDGEDGDEDGDGADEEGED